MNSLREGVFFYAVVSRYSQGPIDVLGLVDTRDILWGSYDETS